MKIVIAHKFLFEGGGPEKAILNLKLMLEKDGHNVCFFLMNSKKNIKTGFEKYFVSEIDLQNIKNIKSRIKAALRILYSFEAKNNMKKLIDDETPDIAQLNNIYHQLSPSIIDALKEKGIPIVFTFRDYKLFCPNYYFLDNSWRICEDCKGKHFYNAVLKKCVKNSYLGSAVCALEGYMHRRTYKKIDYFISPSKFLAEKAIKYSNISPEKIMVIPNSIDLDLFEPEINCGDYVIFIGRPSKLKGVYTLIQAMKNVDTKLVIVGNSEELPDLKLFTAEKEVTNIEFVGYKIGKELIEYLKKSKFLIFPSECYENCPNTIIEAFASGKPVIASDLGGMKELVNDGINGLLFKPGNPEDLQEKINYLLYNPEKISEFGKNARKKAEEEYDIKKNYKRIIEVYKRVIGN